MEMPTLPRMLLLFACLMLGDSAAAAVYCVNSSAAISNAFVSADTSANGSVQEIRVRTGSYSISGNLLFSGGSDKEFSLTGGWNTDCSVRTINAANTILDGGSQSSSGSQFAFTGNHRAYRIEGIRFQNFRSFVLFEEICPFGQSCADTESIRVRYNHFRNGISAVITANDAQTYTVSNNLFENLIGDPASTSEATVRLAYVNEDAIPQVSFNTFSLGCAGGHPGLRLNSQKSAALFSHNILVGSGCGTPLLVDNAFSGKAWVFRNNLYPVVNGGLLPAAGSGGNLIGVNPQFVSATDFHLRESAPVSPAINAGLTPVEASLGNLAVPAQDLDGPAGVRLVGSRYDMGAYESSINDASAITVTSSSDSGAGSLRTAINSANATPGLQKILFNIPGSCTTLPHLIQLQSPLPDITDSVEIDGYSEPETRPNTMLLGTDAVLCIVILAQSGTLAQALQVPDTAPAATSLTVRGIAFAGSTGFNGNFSVALRLRGGSNHLIQGNAFAGTGPGVIGPLGELNFGVQIRDSAQNAAIGGAEPEHRNSFGAMTTSAIVLNDASSGGHLIQNNYIGLSASGLAASPIGLNGIFASASANVRILDNVISSAANSAALSISGATATGYEIARNRLGTSASGVATAAFRNGTGITISSGSGGHQIGGILTASVSNTITNSSGPGVHLTPTAGNGTSVRPNRIFANAQGGSGLGIDLGALGPLANDAGDGDAGPNNGQNTPVISASAVNADGTRQVSGTLNTQAGTYIIDLYRSPDCPSGLGNMLNLLATEFVTTGSGAASFNVTVPAAGAPGVLTAVATRVATGDSSEISACFQERHATTTTIVGDTPDPHQVGQGFAVTVNVASPTGGIPAGVVNISGSGESCQITLSPFNNFAQGSCNLPGNWLGSANLIAAYPGNPNFLPSSDSEPHTGIAAATVTTITSDEPDPSTVGQPYSVSVIVTSNPGAGAPTGAVAVTDGSGASCTLTLSAGSGSCQLTSNTPGGKTLTATYTPANPSFAASSDTEPHNVNPAGAAATTTTITSDTPDPSRVGQPFTVSISVTSPAGPVTGLANVNSGAGGATCQATISNGNGSCQLAGNAAGAPLLTACMVANANFAGSCDTEGHSVIKADTGFDGLDFTPNPARIGVPTLASVVFGVKPPGTGSPSGTITITASAGEQCSFSLPATACTLQFSAPGERTVALVYPGDVNFNPASAFVPVVVLGNAIFANGFGN